MKEKKILTKMVFIRRVCVKYLKSYDILKKFKIVEVRCVEFKSALRKSPHHGEPSGVRTVDLLMF